METKSSTEPTGLAHAISVAGKLHRYADFSKIKEEGTI